MFIRFALEAHVSRYSILALLGFRISEKETTILPPQNDSGDSPLYKGEGSLSPHLRGPNEVGWERRDD